MALDFTLIKEEVLQNKDSAYHVVLDGVQFEDNDTLYVTMIVEAGNVVIAVLIEGEEHYSNEGVWTVEEFLKWNDQWFDVKVGQLMLYAQPY